MRALRTVLSVFLILIITGGVGYLAYTYVFMGGMSHGGMNMGPVETAAPGAMQGMDGMQNTAVPNVIASQNRDRLTQASNMIDEAMNLISTDPYSKATVPNQNIAQTQTNLGNGTVNVYPGGNSSVTITPDTISPAVTVAPAATAIPGTAFNGAQVNNYVYDQSLLRQLHSNIYNIAQGLTLIKELNDDLLIQSSTTEPNPPDYQTYVTRYNTALKNKTKLNTAVSKLNSISTLVNINPYASQNGFEINSGNMDILHQGIYKLAQAMISISRLNDDFTRQMSDASLGAANSMSGMNMSMTSMSTINFSTIFNIMVIVLIVGLVAGIIGAIARMIRQNNYKPDDTDDSKAT